MTNGLCFPYTLIYKGDLTCRCECACEICWYDVASCESVRYFLPGTLIRTTFFPAQFLLASYSCGRPQLAGSESVLGTQLQFDVSKGSHRIMDSIEAPKAGYVTKDLLKLDALWEFVANLQWCHYVFKASRATEYFWLSLSINCAR